MQVQQNQSSGYFSMLGNVASYVSTKATSLWTAAQSEGPIQLSMNSQIRSLIGIYSMYKFPGTAIAGATLANIAPERVKQVTDMLEGAISGLWKKLSVNQKAALAVAGIACAAYCDPTMLFTGLGTIFAAKLGAEYAQRNRVKEVRSAAEAIATRNLADPEKMN